MKMPMRNNIYSAEPLLQTHFKFLFNSNLTSREKLPLRGPQRRVAAKHDLGSPVRSPPRGSREACPGSKGDPAACCMSDCRVCSHLRT